MSEPQQSGIVLLAAYIGGIGYFIGPVLGAILVTYLQIMLSDVTEVWQLYFGLMFIARGDVRPRWAGWSPDDACAVDGAHASCTCSCCPMRCY